jgi:hypothetical protein
MSQNHIQAQDNKRSQHVQYFLIKRYANRIQNKRKEKGVGF